MKITLLKKSKAHGIRKFNFTEAQVIGIVCFLLALPIMTGVAGYRLAVKPQEQQISDLAIVELRETLELQQSELEEAKESAQLQLDALTARIGGLQAELVRINALGQRVAELANVNKSEFDFSQAPGLGGPESPLPESSEYQASDFLKDLEDFSALLNDRAYQIEILESVLLNKEISSERRISGRPITKGWLSSNYGTRTDPFHGKPAWHGGIDFAGTEGADVIATGAGVVTYAGARSNYGKLIEINHGENLTTRYAHNSELLVKVGDVVSKGQLIAKMGSEGRSTGPHVHYEVLKNGKTLDPRKFVNRL